MLRTQGVVTDSRRARRARSERTPEQQTHYRCSPVVRMIAYPSSSLRTITHIGKTARTGRS
jgi:hypothetical protein